MNSYLFGKSAARFAIGLLAASLIAASFSAQATTITTYFDRTAFTDATGGLNPVSLPFLAQYQYIWPDNRFRSGGLTITDLDGNDRLFLLSPQTYSTTFTSTYVNLNNQDSHIGFTFATPVYGFGLDLGVLLNWGKAPKLIETFTINGIGTEIELDGTVSNIYGTAVAPKFVGFLSDTPFTEATLYDPTWSVVFNNIAYAASLPAPTGLPEPGSMALLVIGAASLVVGRRRRGKTMLQCSQPDLEGK